MTCEYCKEIYAAIENFHISEWRLFYTDGCVGTKTSFGLSSKFPEFACPVCHQDLSFTDGEKEDDEAEANRVQGLGYEEAKKRGVERARGVEYGPKGEEDNAEG